MPGTSCPSCGQPIHHWCYNCATRCSSNPKTPELQKPGVSYLHLLGDNRCEQHRARCSSCSWVAPLDIYLASSFDLIDTVQVVCEILEEEGHNILVKWWSSHGFDMWDKKVSLDSDAFYKDPICGKIYEVDFNGVKRANALVLVGAAVAPIPFNGANVELGMALAYGKPCYSVGQLKSSAMYYPVVKCKNTEELLHALRGVQ